MARCTARATHTAVRARAYIRGAATNAPLNETGGNLYAGLPARIADEGIIEEMPLTGNILITGGSGTLGHAILTKAAREQWDARFTIYARSESRLARMRQRFPHAHYLIGDVRDYERLEAAVAGHDVVIHAAAMKRIPECEQAPGECFATNVQGSANVARACVRQGVTTAIAISTDKACRAITVYGASKLMMEGIWRGQEEGATRFVAVRYGNVVASTGSVIPLWREQYKQGKPLTITDQRMTRFWMAPSEAVELIETAFIGAKCNEVLIPKMHALSIPSLANIICPGAKLTEIGLRSTEKLHEDLVHTCEATMETPNIFALSSLGEIGHSYDSARCPTLNKDAFLSMLAESEELERCG